MSEWALEVEGLTKVFRSGGLLRRRSGVTAVDDVSFGVAVGSSLAIVGESGSGKTTTARMIMGLVRPSAGRIVIGGIERGARRLNTMQRKALGRQVQYVFQDPYSSLDPKQRVGDCIAEMVRFHHGLPRNTARRRAAELLEQVGMDAQYADRFPGALSGGQQQRVAIARALAATPSVLILDEAVAALDVSVQAQVLNLLADIREATGVTLLFIAHDLAVVRQVSDDTVVMCQGAIVERGATDVVLDSPRHPYTQKLLAAIPRRGWKPPRRRGEHREGGSGSGSLGCAGSSGCTDP